MIDKMLHGLRNLIGLGWGVVIDDASEVQKVQVKFNPAEVKDNIPRYTEYGFQSSPPDGHHALVLFFGGHKSTGVVVSTHHSESRKRNLKKGEVCISDDLGQEVYLTREGITLIDKSGTAIQLKGDGTGSINSSGTFEINGVKFKDGVVEATDLKAGNKTFNEHHHKDSRNGDTTAPV